MSDSINNIHTMPSGKNGTNLAFVMLCAYNFLVVWRPWESIRYLHGIPVERIVGLLLIFSVLSLGKFTIVAAPTNKYVYGLLILHFFLVPFSFISDAALNQSTEYTKVVLIYLIMLSLIDDEDKLRKTIVILVFATFLYSIHSLWEYGNGKYVWRMGIKRMVGAASTYSDPNAFGASLVLSMPFAYCLLRTEVKKLYVRAYYSFFIVAVTCLILTGSRSATVGFIFLISLWVLMQKGKRKFTMLFLALVALCAVWQFMPVDKQDRVRTLWDENAGPENAYTSADGRKNGFIAGWKIFKEAPLTGVGPGGENFYEYRQLFLDGVPEQAHNILGQVLAGLGVGGFFLLLGLVISIWRTAYKIIKVSEGNTGGEIDTDFPKSVARAVLACLLLLLLLGIGGHNFYRPHWLWLAAWAGALLRVFTLRPRGKGAFDV